MLGWIESNVILWERPNQSFRPFILHRPKMLNSSQVFFPNFWPFLCPQKDISNSKVLISIISRHSYSRSYFILLRDDVSLSGFEAVILRKSISLKQPKIIPQLALTSSRWMVASQWWLYFSFRKIFKCEMNFQQSGNFWWDIELMLTFSRFRCIRQNYPKTSQCLVGLQ